jgi:hypothetical protein
VRSRNGRASLSTPAPPATARGLRRPAFRAPPRAHLSRVMLPVAQRKRVAARTLAWASLFRTRLVPSLLPSAARRAVRRLPSSCAPPQQEFSRQFVERPDSVPAQSAHGAEETVRSTAACISVVHPPSPFRTPCPRLQLRAFTFHEKRRRAASCTCWRRTHASCSARSHVWLATRSVRSCFQRSVRSCFNGSLPSEFGALTALTTSCARTRAAPV